MANVIETRQLSRHFGHDDTLVKALQNNNISIAKGEFTAIIGPSGSGKTTLLQLMGGLDIPTEGDVLLDGQSMKAMSANTLSDFRHDHIGFIFQAYNLIPVLSAAENVEYIMQLQGIDDASRRERTQSMLSLVGLDGYADRRPSEHWRALNALPWHARWCRSQVSFLQMSQQQTLAPVYWI